MEEHEPYGPAWAREVGRLTKAQLIAVLADVGRERDRLARRLAEVGDIVRGAMSSQLLKFAGYDVASASRNPRMKDLCEKAHSIIQIAKEGK